MRHELTDPKLFLAIAQARNRDKAMLQGMKEFASAFATGEP